MNRVSNQIICRLARRATLALALSLLVGSLLPTPSVAQGELSSAWTASRAELERRVTLLDALAASTAYSERARARSAQEAASIRKRLADGDFRVGDRIYVEIEGTVPVAGAATPQSAVQDTLTVLDGARITVRGVGEISLVGVLRAELQERVNRAVNEVILNSRSTTRPLVRLAVFGAVTSPGYYSIPLETRLDNLIMLAGGPTVLASTEKMRVVRGDTIVLDASEVRSFIAGGAVVGAMGLQEGDQLTIEPGAQPLDRNQALQLITLFLAPVISALVLRLIQ
jgi:protein involved in polysaccharide export with SLBB domain